MTEVSADGSTVRVETELHNVNARFDHVFDSDSTQMEVYEKVRFAAESVVQGFNSTIFAYGQTGSGKSFTMFGPEDDLSIYGAEALSENMGVIPRAVREVLTIAERRQRQSGSEGDEDEEEEVSIYCSFMQIYNDQPFDLLRDPNRQRPLQVHENTETKEIYVVGLSEYAVTSLHECMALLEQGDEQRACRQTQMNDVSSRSHSIFQMCVERRKKKSGRVIRAKLNLVDLAGSEKWGTMEQLDKGHVSELTNINTSLHTLGRCIAALTDPHSTHVPFRDSKLTRILQDALGGNSRTCVIATLSPAETFVEESISTLKFADRAKRVMQHARVVETREVSLELVLRLESEIEHLRGLLQAHGISYSSSLSPAPGSVLQLQDAHSIDRTSAVTSLALMDSAGASTTALVPRDDGGRTSTSSFAVAKDLFDAKEKIAKLEKENQKLRSDQDAGVTPRKIQAAVAAAKSEANADAAGLKAENRRLKTMLGSLKKCADKFFSFEIEEQEFQVEFRRYLSGASSNAAAGLTPRDSGPSTTIPVAYRVRGMGDRIEQDQGSRQDSSEHSSKKKKKSSVSGKSGSHLSSSGTSESETKSLSTSLREKQKELAKHKKLQQWLAAKAQRELDRLEENRSRRGGGGGSENNNSESTDVNEDAENAPSITSPLPDGKSRKHSSFVKQKLRSMKNRTRVADAPASSSPFPSAREEVTR